MKATVTAPAGLNLRTGPGTQHEAVGWLSRDSWLTAYQKEGDWLRVAGGYVFAGNTSWLRVEGEMPAPPPQTTLLSGVDVSQWQGAIDWRLMVEQGVKVAGIKVTEGATHVDPRWRENHKWARAYGLKVFPYHFYRNDIDPRVQAANFTAQVKSVSWDFPPAGDFEDRKAALPTPANVQSFMEWSNADIVYTSPGWWNEFIGFQVWAGQYRLWVANWEVAKPQLPAGWSAWWGWQHTITDDAAKYGVQSKQLDLDWFHDSADGLLTHWPVDSHALSIGGNTWGNPPGHEAVDLQARRNDPVYAAANGLVERVAYQTDGYGRFIVVGHPWGSTLYAHLTDKVNVVAGQLIDGGEKLGAVGMTGATSGPHLHFEMTEGETRVDPWPHLQALE